MADVNFNELFTKRILRFHYISPFKSCLLLSWLPAAALLIPVWGYYLLTFAKVRLLWALYLLFWRLYLCNPQVKFHCCVNICFQLGTKWLLANQITQQLIFISSRVTTALFAYWAQCVLPSDVQTKLQATFKHRRFCLLVYSCFLDSNWKPWHGAAKEHQAFPVGLRWPLAVRGCGAAELFLLQPPPAQTTWDVLNTYPCIFLIEGKGVFCFLQDYGFLCVVPWCANSKYLLWLLKQFYQDY